MDVAQWAAKHLYLSRRTSGMPGYFRAEVTPYLVGPLECVTDRAISKIVLCFATQTGKTTFQFAVMGYHIDYDPGPILFVMPTTAICEYTSRNRIQPVIEDCDSLVSKFPPKHQWKLCEMPFDGGVLSLVGANSPSQLASRPVRILQMDETGKFPDQTGREASAQDLAEERTKAQPLSKTIATSTPVQAGDPILSDLENSDYRKFNLPCPLCGEFQELLFEQMKWPKDVKSGSRVSPVAAKNNTHYECRHCKGKLYEKNKKWMLANGHWIKRGQKIKRLRGRHIKGVEDFSLEVPGVGMRRYQILGDIEENPIAGFHLNGLYSPFVSWGELVHQFLLSKEDIPKLQNFVNSVLAEPFRQRTLKADESEIQKHIWPAVKCGVVPEGYEYITAGADIMEKYLAYTVWAWRDDGARHLLEYGELADIDDLEQITSASYELFDKRRLGVGALFVDSRYRLTEVEDFCKKFANAFCCKGSSVNTVPRTGPVSLGYVKTDSRNKRLPQHLWRAYVNVHTGSFKEELHVALETPWDFQGEAPERFVSLHGETEMDFILQLTAEERVEKIDIRGRTTHEWKQKRKDNHYLDCSVYAVAAFRYFYGEWSRGRVELETQLRQKRQEEEAGRRSISKRDPWQPRGVKL
jgi:phage terminase large subunit GpA-like protein